MKVSDTDTSEERSGSMQQTALVFDLDGTLVDSLPDLCTALNEMLRGLGRRDRRQTKCDA